MHFGIRFKTCHSCSHRSLLKFLEMQFQSIFLTAADSSHLGRLDYASLSTQALMEILIEGIENREVICGSRQEPADIDEWRGVEYLQKQPVDISEKYFNIRWFNLGLVGTIDLQWLPPTIILFIVFRNRLSGSLNLAGLPPSMLVLDLSCNEFSGEIDLCHLPTEIKELKLVHNQLSGSLNIEKLPQSIETLYLGDNHFSGTVCFRYLPAGLQNLSVSNNKLSGVVHLTHVPVKMKYLWLSMNNFEGETDFSQLPAGLSALDVSATNLSGEIVVGNRVTDFDTEDSNVQLIQ